MCIQGYSRATLFVQLLLLYVAFKAAPISKSRSICGHGIRAPLLRQRVTGSFARFPAQLMPTSSINTPVLVVVQTIWGNGSCFNTEVRLNCSLEDTGLSIKHKIASETGVPVSLQKLYVSDDVLTPASRTCLGDRERVAEYQSLLRLRHDTKELQLKVVLELPVPLCYKMKADPNNRVEYVKALRRYNSMLSKVKDARKDPKILLEAPACEDTEAKDPTSSSDKPIAEEQPITDTHKNRWILPNRRLHLLFFHDVPRCQNTLSEYVSSWLNTQLPIDWVGNAKFAFLCYVIRATCENEPWVKDLLLYIPPITLFCQTRPGRLLCRTVFHLLPTKIIPNVLTNVLPAHIAQQLS